MSEKQKSQGASKKNISKEIEKLEKGFEGHKSLLGEILATLIINVERKYIKFISKDAAKMWDKMIQMWKRRHKELSS